MVYAGIFRSNSAAALRSGDLASTRGSPPLWLTESIRAFVQGENLLKTVGVSGINSVILHMKNKLQIEYSGIIPYETAFRRQLELHEMRVSDRIPDTLLLLEHPHVYTLGRHARKENLVWTEPERQVHKVEVQQTDRGGDVTYHGPGQLVGYPIIKLTERGLLPRRMVEWVENSVIQTLEAFGIKAGIHPDYPGVWVDEAKICAIGMRIREGVSYHGFALNVSTDLSYFAGIVPCGISDKHVCSMESVLGEHTDILEVRETLSVIAAKLLPGIP
jgi:lipoyl(octanoyl) transferase